MLSPPNMLQHAAAFEGPLAESRTAVEQLVRTPQVSGVVSAHLPGLAAVAQALAATGVIVKEDLSVVEARHKAAAADTAAHALAAEQDRAVAEQQRTAAAAASAAAVVDLTRQLAALQAASAAAAVVAANNSDLRLAAAVANGVAEGDRRVAAAVVAERVSWHGLSLTTLPPTVLS